MKVNDIIGQMKEVGKWGFLREDSVAAAKSGIDKPTGFMKIPSTLSTPKKENSIVYRRSIVIEKAILRFKAMRPEFGIVKKTPNTCVDVYGVGYYFKYSKPHQYKKRESLHYWYGYNRVPLALAGCSKIVLCLVMADVERIVLLPKSEIEVRTVAGGLSRSSVGSPHWNIKLFRNVEDGSITWHVGAEETGEKILLTDII